MSDLKTKILVTLITLYTTTEILAQLAYDKTRGTLENLLRNKL